jgi:hypothetical protein
MARQIGTAPASFGAMGAPRQIARAPEQPEGGDDDHWMALPHLQFKQSMWGDQYTICSNGRFTSGYVRDSSSTATRYEVSPGIQKDPGFKVGDWFQGAVYPPGTGRGLIDVDPCCNAAALSAPMPLRLSRLSRVPATVSRAPGARADEQHDRKDGQSCPVR